MICSSLKVTFMAPFHAFSFWTFVIIKTVEVELPSGTLPCYSFLWLGAHAKPTYFITYITLYVVRHSITLLPTFSLSLKVP